MWHAKFIVSTALSLAAITGVHAASCSKEDFGRAVDQAGAALRKLNADNAPRLRAKMRELKDRNSWADAGFEEKALAAVEDDRIAGYNAQANDLLAKLDQLGSIEPASDEDCAKIQEVGAASLELQATIKAKASYTLAKLDQMLAPTPVSPPPASPPAEPKAKAVEAKPRVEAKPLPPAAPPPPMAAAPPPTAAPAGAPRPPPPGKTAQTSGWSAQTKSGGTADVAVLAPPPQASLAPLPPGNLGPDEEGYTIDEIMAASAGFFGKVSANLGAVIEHLFESSGRPAGYVLGTEGGGALLAGVRYGSGTLYLRSGGSQKIYWHGPSLGTDVGAEGSKTLFLIYHLESPEQVYSSFTGIDGSAYLVGGVGATFVTNGTVIMAPIRSGMGLRLGANIGYIRFTSRATWNPF
ncbi:MAG TPA: DUF1134 domain-containing protein [Hyphomicrobiaceae bacterium]|nr:DUF1134 domain-containing protein [Hyphomicrobiaceae bacterium]